MANLGPSGVSQPSPYHSCSTHLMVPPSIAASGMTLNASPARSIVTLTTPEESGEVSRETSVCEKDGARGGGSRG